MLFVLKKVIIRFLPLRQHLYPTRHKMSEIINKLFSVLCFSAAFAGNAQTGSIADTINKSDREVVSGKAAGELPSFRYKPEFVTELSPELAETSGLVFFDGQLWTINDGGNPAELFQVDTLTGTILRKVTIGNSVNIDWESITQSDRSLYIGDFGNNFGNRKDLRIAVLSKSDFNNPLTDTVWAEFISFNYSDQNDFAPALNKNNFDCEAFFYHNDSLHLFSKNWSDLYTRHYILPAVQGTYQAIFSEQFYADGLITDAAINNDGTVVLLGYKNTGGRFYRCFAWLLTEYEGYRFFTGTKRRIELGSALHIGQAEGIILKNNNNGWISSESIRLKLIRHPAKLFYFDFSEFFTTENQESTMQSGEINDQE